MRKVISSRRGSELPAEFSGITPMTGSFQFKQAAFVEDHGDGGGSDWLCEGSKIKES